MRIDGALGLLPAGRQAFQPRWLIRVGITLSAILHGIVIFAVLFHRQHRPDAINEGLLTIIPVDLVAPPYAVPRPDATPQHNSITPPAGTAAPAPTDQVVPRFEMHMFSKAPSEAMANQAERAASESLVERRDRNPAEAVSENANFRNTSNGVSAKALSNPDAIRKQIARCWRLVPEDQKTPISVSLVLTIAGAIEEPPQITTPTGESSTPTTLQAIRQAIYTCAPYKLPTDSFNEWHRITLSLDLAITQTGNMDK